MAFTPDPYLFNNAAMGGLRTGSALADIFQQRQNRSRLAEIAQQVQQGNFNDAGAGLIGMGQVGQGIQAVNIPYNRDQQELQRQFQNQQAEYQRMQSDRSFGLQERGLNAEEAYRKQKLELERQNAEMEQRQKQDALAAKQAAANSPSAKFSDEMSLAKDFQNVTKDYRDVRDAYTRIKVSAQDSSGPGDVALIFNYMKMLDPGSTVRESEFATAENSGGVGAQIRNLFNKVKSGERLTPEQRVQISGLAQKLYLGQENQYKQTENEYRKRAEQYGFEPSRIFSDFSQAQTQEPNLRRQFELTLPANQRTPIGTATDNMTVAPVGGGQRTTKNGITFTVEQ